eukprot:CAMPEP_0204830512 /NCGR_PEP_ID=MMETSP1346-20131115/8740_1 /ASSEMBLY_ACC=CAM_ASM_000771 /TAXON_ID=215587 /ORGANISM="Aplanochytrium stocchinoi, Strain GSBS06" /LENGTH=75 /DNA_ID=CAMNT_0051960823 /DNA_START=670 /DNA_END=893 /DNA_ORIENTATION=+
MTLYGAYFILMRPSRNKIFEMNTKALVLLLDGRVPVSGVGVYITPIQTQSYAQKKDEHAYEGCGCLIGKLVTIVL